MTGFMIASLMVALSASPQQAAPPPTLVAIVVAPAGETQELRLKDGTRAIGRVESIEGTHFMFRTTSGVVMDVETVQVQALEAMKGKVVDGDFWFEDPNPTRLFFAPTGRSLRKGEAYFGVYEVLLPFVQVGVTDRISIGAGTPLVFGAGDIPFWVTPKVQVIRRKSLEASVGVLHFVNVGDANVGIAYGVVTKGSTNSAITVGAGYAYLRADDENEIGGAPVFMLGGEHRITRRLKLVTENYGFEEGGLLSGGLRFLGERLSVDFGMVAPFDDSDIIAFPILNFVWKF